MMKRLLWWCIWLLLIENGQLRIDSYAAVAPPVSRGLVRAQRMPQSLLSTLNYQLSINALPCSDSSPTCLQTLGDLAVQNSREIAVLKQAIALQKKKLWTSWLSADGWHPLAIGLHIARNLAGGGDRAAAKLEIARLDLRRIEIATNLHQAIRQAVWEYERLQQELAVTQNKRAYHQARLQIAEISYRLGESHTEAILSLWQTSEELQTQVTLTAGQMRSVKSKLESLLGFK